MNSSRRWGLTGVCARRCLKRSAGRLRARRVDRPRLVARGAICGRLDDTRRCIAQNRLCDVNQPGGTDKMRSRIYARYDSVRAATSRKEMLFNAASGDQRNKGGHACGVAEMRDLSVHQGLYFTGIAASLFGQSPHGGVVGLRQRAMWIHVSQWLCPIWFVRFDCIPLDFLVRRGGHWRS
jgi:hypothetical protein